MSLKPPNRSVARITSPGLLLPGGGDDFPLAVVMITHFPALRCCCLALLVRSQRTDTAGQGGSPCGDTAVGVSIS